jgi:3-dehydroquinate dehydratase-2
VARAQELRRSAGSLTNAGAYTHTSLALRDALDTVRRSVLVVHISNMQAGERLRDHFASAGACDRRRL